MRYDIGSHLGPLGATLVHLKEVVGHLGAILEPLGGDLGVPNLAVACNGENGMWSWTVLVSLGCLLDGLGASWGGLGALLGAEQHLYQKQKKLIGTLGASFEGS